jgi:hypothetical protein
LRLAVKHELRGQEALAFWCRRTLASAIHLPIADVFATADGTIYATDYNAGLTVAEFTG